MPFYKIETFKQSCEDDKDSVFVWKQALDDAAFHFNLRSKEDLLDFVANDGLQNIFFVNSKKWENNPNPAQPIVIDGYRFQSLSKIGYIAFFMNDRTSKWNLKSFHPHRTGDERMKIAFEKLGLAS